MKEYQRFGNVIIGWKVNTTMAFAGLLRHFIPPPATIIDLTAGERRMYRKMEKNHTIDNSGYDFIFGDIRDLPGLHHVCDIREPPIELYGRGDGVVFDPPWPASSGSLDGMVAKYCPMTKAEFPEFLKRAFHGISNILKNNGVLIVKIPHPWNHIIYNSLTQNGYKWIRDIPQLSIYHSVYLITYFMIFEKK
jgi:hypothetical protein